MIGVFLLKNCGWYALLAACILFSQLYYTFYIGRAYDELNSLPLQYAVHLDVKNGDPASSTGGTFDNPLADLPLKVKYETLYQPTLLGRSYVPHSPGYWDRHGGAYDEAVPGYVRVFWASFPLARLRRDL